MKQLRNKQFQKILSVYNPSSLSFQHIKQNWSSNQTGSSDITTYTNSVIYFTLPSSLILNIQAPPYNVQADDFPLNKLNQEE
jgi:hypothetical protein